MSSINELRMTITRRVNLGNYEHVEFSASAMVSRDADTDTSEKMRNHLLDELNTLIDEAKKDHVPKRRSRYDED